MLFKIQIHSSGSVGDGAGVASQLQGPQFEGFEVRDCVVFRISFPCAHGFPSDSKNYARRWANTAQGVNACECVYTVACDGLASL